MNRSLVQKLTSLKQGGNLEYGLKRAERLPALNCFRNRWSSVQNSLRPRPWAGRLSHPDQPDPLGAGQLVCKRASRRPTTAAIHSLPLQRQLRRSSIGGGRGGRA